MAERELTPSKITAWLDCPHYLTLKHQVEGGGRARPEQPFGSFARLLQDKGLEHEADCLARYEADGRRIVRVEDKPKGETFAAWAERMRPMLDADADLLFQMPFVHDGVRGVADFLERHEDPDTRAARWEPVDAKLARSPSQARPRAAAVLLRRGARRHHGDPTSRSCRCHWARASPSTCASRTSDRTGTASESSSTR